jgi:hypothetical protein
MSDEIPFVEQTAKQAAMSKAVAAKAAKRAASPNSSIEVDYIDTVFPPKSAAAAIQSAFHVAVKDLDLKTQVVSNIPTNSTLDDNRITIVREYIDANTNNKIGAAILSLPTIAEILSTPAGVEFAQRSVEASFGRKLGSMMASFFKSDRSIMPSLPSTLAELMSAARQTSTADISTRKRFSQDSWKKYRGDIKKLIIDMFAKKGITINLTAVDLEQCLESQAIAAVKLPKVPAAMFDKLIDRLISLPAVTIVDDKGKSRTDKGELYAFWKATRYNVEQSDGELSLDDLNFAQ